MDILSCPSCREDFNLTKRLPNIVNCCFESICFACIKEILHTRPNEFQCPQCKKLEIVLNENGREPFKVNLIIQRVLEKRIGIEKCVKHDEMFRFKCFQDNEKLCDLCVEDGHHRGHDLKSLIRINSECKQQRQKLEQKVKELDDKFEEIDVNISKSEEVFLTKINDKFLEISKQIASQKEKFSSEIKSFFEQEREKVKNTLGKESKIRTKAIDKIEKLERYKDIEYSKHSRKEVSELLTTLQITDDKTYSETMDGLFDLFNTSLTNRLQPFWEFRFPQEKYSQKLDIILFNKEKPERKKTMIESPKILEYHQGKEDKKLVIEPNQETLKFNIEKKDMKKFVIEPRKSQELHQEKKDNIKTVIESPVVHEHRQEKIKPIIEESPKLHQEKQEKILVVESLQESPKVHREKRDMRRFVAGRVHGFPDVSSNVALSYVDDFLEVSVKEEVLIIRAPKIHMNSKHNGQNGKINLDKLDKIKRVYLKFEKFFASNKPLMALSVIFSRLYEIKSLIIEFIPEGLDDNSLSISLPHIFETISTLNELDLNFRGCNIGDNSIMYLAGVSYKMTDLTIIRLNLASSLVTHKSIRPLLSSFQPIMKKLIEFRLDLSKTEFEDQTSAPLLINMESLKKFTLNLSLTKLTDMAVEAFFKDTSTYQALEEFNVNLCGANISDRTFSFIFKEMPLSCQTFILALTKTNLNDASLSIFLQKTISKMKSLEMFVMNVVDTYLTDKGIHDLFSKLPKVKKLKLHVGLEKVTDSCMRTLGTRLTGMKDDMTHLDVDLQKALATPEGLSRLFVKLPNLENLSLNLSNTKFNDQNLKNFTENMLGHMRTLKEFRLNLSSTTVTDQEVRDLLGGMKRNVKVFMLLLQYTKVTNQGIDLFLKNIKQSFKSLEKFDMNLSNTKVTLPLLQQIEGLRKEISP